MMTEILKQIAGGNDCEDLWNWVAFTVGVILSAITGDSLLLFLCVAVRKDLKILSCKTTALLSLGMPACLSVCLFVGQNSRATEKIFIVFCIYVIFNGASKFLLKSDKVVDVVTEKYKKTWMLGCTCFEHILQGIYDYVDKRKKM